MRDNLIHFLARTMAATLCCLVVVWLVGSPAFAQGIGSIMGKVTDTKSGEALSSINVRVKGTALGTMTDLDGKYTVRNVPEGMYTVVFSAVGFTMTEVSNVEVKANETTIADAALTAVAIPLGETLVYGASLRPERITEAPAAVSVIGPEEISQQGGHSQLPRLLETVPGIDIVQSGVQDFNINARGFNTSLNRRLLVLMDGRDLSIVLLGSQEWNGLSVPLEDLGRIELVRGPGSALYGANAYNGVISITTLAPKDVIGTKISVMGGELGTYRGDVRHAGISGDWSYRVNLGGIRTDTWTKSRTIAPFEYSGLSPEIRKYPANHLSSAYQNACIEGRRMSAIVFQDWDNSVCIASNYLS